MKFGNIYDSRRIWKIGLVAASLVLVAVFLLLSNRLVKDLAAQERSRMKIWAGATRELITSNNTDVNFLLDIIKSNNNIPVLLVDGDDNILEQRNFNLPEPVDTLNPGALSERNMEYLQCKLQSLKNTNHKIDITIDEEMSQTLYYEDSTVLRQLAYFPYVQLAVLLIFIAIAYFALISVKRAEQNKVWVGLSKETAHQLGTPISSLMAWNELLGQIGVDPEIVTDMDKDVTRLRTIADRFSKIGSMPEKEVTDLAAAITGGLQYMSNRIPKRVDMTIDTYALGDDCRVNLCGSLFEWVLENLTKNAVDAMEGAGSLAFVARRDGDNAIITVTDSGKGIPRKNFKTVFTPGYTTKKRGWGLGLTLVKRIIEEYHGGRIWVKESEIGRGTTFAITLPLVAEKTRKSFKKL